MESVGDILKSGSYKKPIVQRIFKCNISATDYAEKFTELATGRMVFSGGDFVVDDDNKDIINQLFYFLVGSDKFNGDPIKGILLMGPYGTGKTIIMESFIDIFNSDSDKRIKSVNSKDIARIQAENEIGFLDKRPLFIDDIGKEQTVVNNYGTVSKPMEDVMNERYKNGAFTLGTSNLKFEDMPYNGHTMDRMKQMFNVMVLPGKSRRK